MGEIELLPLLHLGGSKKHNAYRHRDRANEPLVTTSLLDPPRRLSRPVRLTWSDMKERAFWLTSADRFLVEIASTLIAWHRDANHKITRSCWTATYSAPEKRR